MTKEYKTITKEVEEEITAKVICDNCYRLINSDGSCGMGSAFKLSDAWCSGCGGKCWDFCCLKCLREFVNKPLEQPDFCKKFEDLNNCGARE